MGSYPERYKGKFSSYEVTKLLDRIQPPAIKEAVRRSTREIVIAMAEPGGTLVTLTLESQDGKKFTGRYSPA